MQMLQQEYKEFTNELEELKQISAELLLAYEKQENCFK